MATKQAQGVMKKEEDKKEAHSGTTATREQQWRGLLADTTVGQFLQARDSSGAKKAPQGSNTNEPSFSSSLPSSRHVVTLSSTATVAHALQTLAQHRILSAPVMDATTLHFIGLVDVLDIAGFLLHDVAKDEADLNLIMFTGLPSLNHPISNAINFSLLDRPVPIKENDSLLSVVRTMCNPKGSIKVHRLPVFDDEGNIVNVISQSDVIAWYAKNMDKLPELCQRTVSDLELAHAVISVRNTARFADALSILFENRVSGVAVLAQSKLVGNISASDLRGFGGTDFDISMFNRPVQQMLDKISAKDGPKAPVSCTLDSTLQQAISLVATNRTHRVYVVDEENRAIGVITLSDVLRALLPPKSPDDRPTQAELAAAATGGAIGDLATQAHQQPPKPVFTSRRGSTGASPTASPTARRTRGVEANNRKRKGSIPSLQLIDEDDGEVLTTEPVVTPAQAASGDAAAELHEDKKRRVEE